MARTKLRLVGEQRPDWSGSAAPGGISPVFLCLVAGFIASGAALAAKWGDARVGVFMFVMTGWLVSLCLHEFMHALTAFKGGDHTARDKGYLRLDPLKYGHPLLTFILPLFYVLIGGIPLPGGAVMIENHRLRNRVRSSMVSAAGPLVNIIAAGILLTAAAAAGPVWISSADQSPFWAAVTFLGYLQVLTAILNLLPIPGLDGYGIIEPFLSDEWRGIGNQVRPYGLLIVFALLFAVQPTRDLFAHAGTSIMAAAKAPIDGAYWGQTMVRFWSSN